MREKKNNKIIQILTFIYAIIGAIIVGFIIMYTSFRASAEFTYPQSIDVTSSGDYISVITNQGLTPYLEIGGFGIDEHDEITEQLFDNGLWIYIPSYTYYSYYGNQGYSRIELVYGSTNIVYASIPFIALDLNRPNINGWYYIDTDVLNLQGLGVDVRLRMIIYLSTGYDSNTVYNLVYNGLYVNYGHLIPNPTIIDYSSIDSYWQGYNQGQLDAYNDGFSLSGQVSLDDTLSASYQTGYLVGFNVGLDDAYDQYFQYGFGVNDNQSYSYESGFNAGIPVGEANINSEINIFRDIIPSALGGIWGVVANFLSFEVRGINAWMVLSLFASIAILILVLKLVT